MNEPITCEDFRDLEAEFALGVLSGKDRARAEEHVAQCAACMNSLARFSAAADQVPLAIKSAEPPAGFESRIITRLGLEGSRRTNGRRWTRVLAAGVAAALVVGGVSFTIVNRGQDRFEREYVDALRVLGGRSLRAAKLTDNTGADAGQAFLYEGHPSWVFVFVDSKAKDEDVELVLSGDDSQVVAGRFHIAGGQGSFGHRIDVPRGQLAFELRAVNGAILFSAKLPD